MGMISWFLQECLGKEKRIDWKRWLQLIAKCVLIWMLIWTNRRWIHLWSNQEKKLCWLENKTLCWNLIYTTFRILRRQLLCIHSLIRSDLTPCHICDTVKKEDKQDVEFSPQVHIVCTGKQAVHLVSICKKCVMEE